MSTAPRLTVIVTQRERFSLSERSLDTVLADRSIPFRLIYVDAGAPTSIAGWLDRRSREAGFELLRVPGPAWPNHGRIAALATVESEYVVFMDNDGLLFPGSLAAMVECADATGAGLVGPLYLWSDGVRRPRIHMAGGTLRMVGRPGGRAMFEIHRMLDADIAEADPLTGPVACDFVEYHCMLARTDLVRGPHGLDPDIVCVHEHIDLSLAARARGLGIYVEPRARLDYLAFADYRLHDLDYFRWRWQASAVDDSLAAFSRKWDILDDAEAYAGIRGFTRLHLARKLPTLQDPDPNPDDNEAPDAPAQSHGLLQRQLARRGYGPDALRAAARAHELAIRLFEGSYRACGRPFLNHAVGVASVLARFRLRADIVLAGLLHAAFSHGRIAGEDADTVGRRIADVFGTDVEQLVRTYHEWQRDPAGFVRARPDPAALTVGDAAALAIAAANGIDELAADEIATSYKRPEGDAALVDYLAVAAGHLGVPGLGRMLHRLRAEARPAAIRVRRVGTFRQAPDTPAQLDRRCYPAAVLPEGTAADVAVVIVGAMRPALLRALGSVCLQTFPGTVQVLIGIAGDGPLAAIDLHQRLEQRPPNVAALVMAPGPAAALRPALGLLANAPLVAFLDPQDWYLRPHLGRMVTAVAGFDWAYSLRWLADAETGERLCRDTWEAIGPGRGVLARTGGGLIDASCVIVDKRRAAGALAAASAAGGPGLGLQLMRALCRGHSVGWTGEHSVVCGVEGGSLQGRLGRNAAFHERLAEAGRMGWSYPRIFARWADLRAAAAGVVPGA
ncbi:MAG: HD domain-containing protein [Alphaproteobacteria bacterium]|nr:HD domain-containing protein [Alphaproteobacteria bacterium]